MPPRRRHPASEMKFFEFTDADGRPVWINVDRIVFFKEADSGPKHGTLIRLAADGRGAGSSLILKEDAQFVADLLARGVGNNC